MTTEIPSSAGRMHGLFYRLIRPPLLIILCLFAPLVQIVCAAMVVLGLLVCLLFEISAVGPTFPFWRTAALYLGFGVFLVLYQLLIALLSRE